MTTSAEILEYYARPGIMTEPREYAELFAGLPTEIPALCEVVQGILLHIFWAERYGVRLSEERKAEVQIRPVARKLARHRELDDRPLTAARSLENKLVGNCRDFTVMLCAMLQHQGVPARARCGFGVYFLPGHYEDHWVCEYWNVTEQRWVMVDAQLDEFQRAALRIDFDVHDMPRDKFVTGGKAWQMCRAGEADPDKFGIFEWHGMAFVRGDLIRDFLAFNKVEILPWDDWKILEVNMETISTEELTFLDHLAALSLAGDAAFAEMRELYERDARLRMPKDWQL